MARRTRPIPRPIKLVEFKAYIKRTDQYIDFEAVCWESGEHLVPNETIRFYECTS